MEKSNKEKYPHPKCDELCYWNCTEGGSIETPKCNKYDVTAFRPPFRVGKKQNRVVLDSTGKEIALFKHSSSQAQMYVDFLNS